VIVKTVIKTVIVEPGDEKVVHFCPTNKKAWADHCASIKNPDDCDRENMCEWLGGSLMRCQRMRCKDQGLPWPRPQ
jgi:hypothetical protein